MPETAPFFSKKLIAWYLQNKRELPWRNTANPYLIWISEIILQQTRVQQGLPYYYAFIEAYPAVKDLANAEETEVLKLWQGLGYYSRARNLHATAKKISEEMKGNFPSTYSGLLKLKGVGEYTASAIASVCFNEPQGAVDGNVYRSLSRIFGISTPINTSAGQKEFKQLAQQLIDKKQPGTFNQAMIEFGSQQCTPQNPDCNNCIFNDRCIAFRDGLIGELPVKIKAKPVKKRYFNYLVVISENEKTHINQRLGKGIWHKLYEFPLIETSKPVNISELKDEAEFQDFSENITIKSISLYNSSPVVHKLSHQHLYTNFWILETSEENSTAVHISEVKKYPLPVLIGNFVSEFFENY